jgi:nicotinate-nucleotide adenylyltransferase
VYPRISDGTVATQFDTHAKIHKVDAPIVQISSTLIRNGIRDGKNIQPMLPKEVWSYIDEMNFYKK